MNIKRVCALYFSPTGGTEQIARFAAAELAQRLGAEVEAIDFTRPENREREYRFSSEDLVLVAAPVYAGRVPNKILPDFQSRVFGSGATPAVPLSVFGNRSEDEALRELASGLRGPPRWCAATHFLRWWAPAGRTRPTGPKSGSLQARWRKSSPPGRRCPSWTSTGAKSAPIIRR